MGLHKIPPGPGWAAAIVYFTHADLAFLAFEEVDMSVKDDQLRAVNVRLRRSERNPYRTFSGACSWEAMPAPFPRSRRGGTRHVHQSPRTHHAFQSGADPVYGPG